MKLNLLPTTVNREGRAKFSWILAVFLAAGGVASMIYLKGTSERFITEQQERIDKAKPQADRAVDYVNRANDLITNNKGLIVNALLAQKMAEHSDKYPQLFDELKPYIPSFFRPTAMSATPTGPDATQINMTGVIHTQQQYADLMLALLRFKDVVSVGRTGFNYQNPKVPGLTPQDQTGRIQKPGDPIWPDDPLARLDAQIAAATSTGFNPAGNFGSTAEPMVRGAMPDWSVINVAMIIRRDLQAPSPIATVQSTSAMWPKVETTPATTTPGTPTNTPPVTPGR